MGLVIEGLSLDDPLRAHVEDRVSTATRRLGRGPTAVRVGFTDENGPKGGADIRCAVTVDLPRRPPLHAGAVAVNPRLAFDLALEALEREVQRERGRRRDAARRPKKYFVARQALLPEGEASLRPTRRRRRTV
jgi:ribosome-associated translation inhibitor RaiA